MEEVRKGLEENGLGCYASKFDDNGWENITLLHEMTDSHIESCIQKPGHIVKFKRALKRLKVEANLAMDQRFMYVKETDLPTVSNKRDICVQANMEFPGEQAWIKALASHIPDRKSTETRRQIEIGSIVEEGFSPSPIELRTVDNDYCDVNDTRTDEHGVIQAGMFGKRSVLDRTPMCEDEAMGIEDDETPEAISYMTSGRSEGLNTTIDRINVDLHMLHTRSDSERAPEFEDETISIQDENTHEAIVDVRHKESVPLNATIDDTTPTVCTLHPLDSENEMVDKLGNSISDIRDCTTDEHRDALDTADIEKMILCRSQTQSGVGRAPNFEDENVDSYDVSIRDISGRRTSELSDALNTAIGTTDTQLCTLHNLSDSERASELKIETVDAPGKSTTDEHNDALNTADMTHMNLDRIQKRSDSERAPEFEQITVNTHLDSLSSKQSDSSNPTTDQIKVELHQVPERSDISKAPMFQDEAVVTQDDSVTEASDDMTSEHNDVLNPATATTNDNLRTVHTLSDSSAQFENQQISLTTTGLEVVPNEYFSEDDESALSSDEERISQLEVAGSYAPNIPGRIPGRSQCYTQILHSEHTTIVEAPSQIGIDSTATTSLDNLKGQMEELANWYKKRDHLYVETHAFRELQSTVEDMHWATVLGKPGDGKTFMAAHLMLKYRNRGFEPVFCNSVDDWRSLVSCGNTGRLPSKQFVIIDDMFGTSCVDSGKVGKWLSMIDMMTKILEERNHTECRLLIVCTSRRYIFSDVESALARFKTFHKFTVIDTTEDGYKLSHTEKINIFRMYVNEQNIEEYKGREIEDIDPPHGFPHCVEMFCTNVFYRDSYGMAFFENPAEYVQRELKNFRDNDRIKYLVLVLVLFHDNRLENAYFQELVANLSKRDKQLFNDTGVFLDTSYPDLMKSLEALHNTYLKKGPSDSYSFTHESIMENVAFVYISSSPVHGIEALDFKYVLAFINSSFKNVVTVETDVLQEIVQLPVGYVKPLVTRATAELTRGNIIAVCSINAWCNSEFVSKWIDHICNTMTSHERISMFCRHEDQAWVWDNDGKVMSLFFQYRSAKKRDMSGAVSIGGSVCMLSALVFLQRKYAVLSILNCSYLRREMNKSAICKEMLENALNLSCEYSHNQDIVKQLLTYQLDGSEALFFALEHGFVDYAEMLIRSSDLIPKYTDCGGRRFLHYLVASDVGINEFKDLCELLLEKGEDINLPNASGKPNLFALVTTIATNKKDLNRLHYLLHCGANINIRDQCGRNLVLHLIKSQSSNVCLHFFAQLQETGLDFHACDDRKQNALHYLLTKQPDIDFGKLFTFLKSKVGVNIVQADYRGRVPLMLALKSGSGLEYVQELLPESPHGHTDNQGRSYFHYLCGSKSQYEQFSLCCMFLLRHGEDLNSIDNAGDSALFRLIARGSNNVFRCWFAINSSLSLQHIQCLHQNGCDIHATDKYGRNIVQNVIMAAKISQMQSVCDPIELLKYFNLNAVDFHNLDAQERNTMHYALGGYSDVWPWHYGAAWNYSWSCKKPVNNASLEEIITFLKDTMDVNFYTQDKDGVSPLMLGLRYYPELQSLKSLLQKQIPSQTDNKGRGYLHYLSRSNAPKEIFEEIFAMLLDGCIDINCVDTLGRSPMFYCSDYERLRRMTFFIENGANINHQDKEGNTILLYLMDCSSMLFSDIRSIISTINLLNQKSADPNIQNKNKVSPVMKALENFSYLTCLEQWVQGTLPLIEDEKGQNYFHYLARTHTSESVFNDLCNALLDNEVDINHEDNRGITPLLECFHAGNLKMFKLLVHFGADIHWQDKNRRNLSMFAFTSDLYWRSRPIIEYLATSGVDCFKQDSEGVNAFMLALSQTCSSKFVNQFVKGTIPDLTDLQGRTYIHYLSRSDAYHSYDFLGKLSGLLKNNIDINARDKLGRTPVFESVIKGQLVTLKVLVDNGAAIYITDNHGVNLVLATLNEGFGLRCMAILKYLRKMGVRFDSLDDNGRNAMHYFFMADVNNSHYHAPGINMISSISLIDYSESFSVGTSGTECILRDCSEKLLNDDDITDIFSFLDKIDGVDIFQQDKQGINPLMLALQNYPYFTCVKECVERKITKQEDSMGSTYFHYLVRSSCSPTTFKAIASALVERGIDINGKDLLDRSPLFECFALGRTEEMDILVELGAKAEETDNWEKHPVIQKRLAHIKTTLQKAGLTLKDSDHEAGWSHNFYYLGLN